MTEPYQYLVSSTAVAHGRDEHGFWQQTLPDGPKLYSDEAEAAMRAVFPSWMLDEEAE